LPLMNAVERKYIHNYVKSQYSDRFITYSVPGPRRDMKTIILRPTR
jgi:hypothetical protein